MIRVAVVDPHPATASGLHALLRREPGLVPVGWAARADAAAELVATARPDVLLVDPGLEDDDGLALARHLKDAPRAPRIVVYSAAADAWLAFAARTAGADALVAKSASIRELFETIRRVVGGEVVLPPVTRKQLHEAAARVGDEDLPLLSMLVDRTAPPDIARTLRIRDGALRRRIDRVLVRLRSEGDAPGGSLLPASG